MTPDPRTEEIRKLSAHMPGHPTFSVVAASDAINYLLARIEALEGVADKARAAVAFIGWESSSAVDLADSLAAALAALDGEKP